MGLYSNYITESKVNTIVESTCGALNELDNFQRIFESINVLNENGIVTEGINVKELWEKAMKKIREFFSWLKGKIKAIWNKITGRDKYIDDFGDFDDFADLVEGIPVGETKKVRVIARGPKLAKALNSKCSQDSESKPELEKVLTNIVKNNDSKETVEITVKKTSDEDPNVTYKIYKGFIPHTDGIMVSPITLAWNIQEDIDDYEEGDDEHLKKGIKVYSKDKRVEEADNEAKMIIDKLNIDISENALEEVTESRSQAINHLKKKFEEVNKEIESSASKSLVKFNKQVSNLEDTILNPKVPDSLKNDSEFISGYISLVKSDLARVKNVFFATVRYIETLKSLCNTINTELGKLTVSQITIE